MVMSHDVNIGQVGSSQEDETYAECRMCKRWIIRTRVMIKLHLDAEHGGMTLKKYFCQHVFNHNGVEVDKGSTLRFIGETAVLGSTRMSCKVIVEKTRNHSFTKMNYFPRTMELHEALKGAQVYKGLADKCIFKCPKCKKKLDRSHLISVHKRHNTVCRQFGKPLRIINWVDKAVAHVCKICGLRVPCDRALLSQHMNLEHSVILADYATLLKRQDTDIVAVLQERKEKEDDLAKELELCLQNIPLVSLANFNMSSVNGIPKEMTTYKVEDLCKFRCSRCPLLTFNFKCFRRHLKACTGSAKSLNIVEARAHLCCICSRRIMCSKEHIRMHVRKHNLNLKEYTDLALVAEKSNTEASRKKLQVEGRYDWEHREKERERLEYLRQSMPVFYPPLKTINMSSADVPREKTTALVVDLCLFRCKFCPSFECSKLDVLNWHKKKRHPEISGKLRPDDILEARYVLYTSCSPEKAFFQHRTFSRRYHFCSLCSRRILCDRRLIERHVKNVHGKKLEEYAKSLEEGENHLFAEETCLEKEESFIAKLKREVKPAPQPLQGNNL